MIVTIVNRSWIEMDTTKEIADMMISRWEISSYKTLDGDSVQGQKEYIEVETQKPKNITRKHKI
jgi:hypothetical protein